MSNKGFIVLGAIVMLLCFGLLLAPVIFFLQQQRYQMASCTINDKYLGSSTNKVTVYSALFTFTVHAVGRQPYEVRGSYDGGVGDRASQNAILDQYNEGQAYPCWYDPSHPDQVILVRHLTSINWWFTGGGLLLGGIFLLTGILGLRRRSKI